MIIQFIINICLYLVRFLIGVLPAHAIDISSFLSTILTYSNQFGNFFNLMFGDSIRIIAPMVLTFCTFRWIALPILIFLRGFIRFGS